MKRAAVVLVLALVAAVSASGQDRSVWRTSADIREGSVGSIVGTVTEIEAGRNQFRIRPDNDPYQPAIVASDSVSTTYYGFGGVINGSPEIFRGTSGFSNVRVGDRVDVHGQGRPGATIAAGQITLLGRSVEADSVGVGTTRSGTSVSTPTAGGTTPTTRIPPSSGVAEGTVRQVNVDENRIVIQTPQRRMITVNATRATPVYFRGEVYRVSNLEIGDVIRVEPEPRTAQADEITARSIEVTQSVQERGDAPSDQRLTAVIGRVTRIDRTADMIRVDTGRQEVRVDMIRAADGSGRRLRASDLRVGDQVDITGSYSSNSDVFIASTVRFGAGEPSGTEIDVEDRDEEEEETVEYVAVSFSGRVTESLDTSPVLLIRDSASGRTLRVHATTDFVIRTKTGSYAAASTLNVGDNVLVKAFRDEDENLVAQTIRIR
jgi:hypothetical protein